MNCLLKFCDNKKSLVTIMFLMTVVTVFLFLSLFPLRSNAAADRGDFIRIKLNPLPAENTFWEFFAPPSGQDGDFDVTVSSWTWLAQPYECALLLTEERAWAADREGITWVADGKILSTTTGNSLSSDLGAIGANWQNCTDTTLPACSMDGAGIDPVASVFNKSYSAGWTDECSGAECILSDSDTYYVPDVEILCEDTWMTCGAAETSCNTYNPGDLRTYACNSGDWTLCTGTATPDCVAGVCVAPAGLALEMSTSDSILSPSGTATITFTVKLSGAGIAGATINGISATSGTIAGSCTPTTAAGTCQLTYTAPAAVPGTNPVIISATDASNGVNTDSGPASTLISINGCPIGPPALIPLPSACVFPTICTSSSRRYQYLGGDNGINCTPSQFNCPDGCNATCDACLSCVSNTCVGVGAGTKWCDGAFVPGVLRDCPGAPCCPAAGPPPPPPCTSIITCTPTNTCSGIPGSMTIDVDCVDTGTCAAPTTTTANPCCSTNADCATGNSCDISTAYGTCVPCTGEGFAPTPSVASLCCDGLNLIDDGTGTMICSSKCDPNAPFFCNPSRGSVETLIQGGEKMIGYILGIIGSVALLLTIISGIMYMTSAGNEEKIASSKKILTGAIIGLAISLLSFSLLQLLISIL